MKLNRILEHELCYVKVQSFNLFRNLILTIVTYELAHCNFCLFNGWEIEFSAWSAANILEWGEREEERKWERKSSWLNECVFILLCPHCSEHTFIYFKHGTWESFWRPSQNPKALHVTSTGLQSSTPSNISKGCRSPSSLCSFPISCI